MDTYHVRIDRPILNRDEYCSLRFCIREASIGVELGKGVMARRKGRNKQGLRKSRRTTRKDAFGTLRGAKGL